MKNAAYILGIVVLAIVCVGIVCAVNAPKWMDGRAPQTAPALPRR